MTAYDLAQRFVGELTELTGNDNHPLIQWFHMLCALGHDQPDATPWCSSFANGVCWLLRLPRSKSAAARSWLTVGRPVLIGEAVVGWDVVVLSRGAAPAGHVGFFAGVDRDHVHVLGGNQGDAVTVQAFDLATVLGVCRLREG